MRAAIFNEHSLALKVGTEIWLKEEENYFSWKIETIKISGEKSCIRLSGCNTLEDAEKPEGESKEKKNEDSDEASEEESS